MRVRRSFWGCGGQLTTCKRLCFANLPVCHYKKVSVWSGLGSQRDRGCCSICVGTRLSRQGVCLHLSVRLESVLRRCPLCMALPTAPRVVRSLTTATMTILQRPILSSPVQRYRLQRPQPQRPRQSTLTRALLRLLALPPKALHLYHRQMSSKTISLPPIVLLINPPFELDRTSRLPMTRGARLLVRMVCPSRPPTSRVGQVCLSPPQVQARQRRIC